ncbi:hypothetical protein CCMA1212_008276 [Trichoderma ghanense]|uniref:Uncharacterized protein n=1 Tax=Trichoderma ghanense TaxID=65468 RepID=A0ABY2GVL6_9HYPO
MSPLLRTNAVVSSSSGVSLRSPALAHEVIGSKRDRCGGASSDEAYEDCMPLLHKLEADVTSVWAAIDSRQGFASADAKAC